MYFKLLIQVISFIFTLQYFNIYIPVKVILKQTAACLILIRPSFSIFNILYTQSTYRPSPKPMVEHPHHILNPTIYYIKGCHSINKQFSFDSFLDW